MAKRRIEGAGLGALFPEGEELGGVLFPPAPAKAPMAAADELNELLDAAEKLFVKRFTVHGTSVVLRAGEPHRLALDKSGDNRGLFVFRDGVRASRTWLCSAGLVWRVRAAGVLGDLWSACEAAQAEAELDVVGAAQAVTEFLEGHKQEG